MRPTIEHPAATVRYQADELLATDQAVVDEAAAKTRVESARQRPIRILHVFSRISHGGMEHTVMKLMAGLDGVRFQQRVCALRGCDNRSDGLELLRQDALIPPPADPKSRTRILWLANAMRSYRPDIVHSRNWGAVEAIVAARLAGVPKVVHSEHGYEMETMQGLPVRRRMARWVLYRMTNIVFCVSKELRDYHAHQAATSTSKIQLIYNAVDTKRFAPDAATRRALREKLGLGGTFTVGAVGRVTPIKNYDLLLEAIRRLVAQGVEVRGVLVGDGPELPRLRATVDASPQLQGRVIFAGASEAVSKWLTAMDAFVQPSLAEGMSNTLLEAMSAGLPVVATATGGNPEVMENGRHGWLYERRDVEGLKDRLARLATDEMLRKQFGTAARQHVVVHFGLQRMLDNYTELYSKLASRAD